MTKYLASEAAWEAGEAAMNALGGYGFAKEYHVERKWREARLYRTAPISNNLILSFVGEHLLGMPRSYQPPQITLQRRWSLAKIESAVAVQMKGLLAAL